HAVRPTEEVLRVAGDVRGAAARRDQKEADIAPAEESRSGLCRAHLALEQMPKRLRLLAQLSLEPRHRSGPRRGLPESPTGRRGRRRRPALRARGSPRPPAPET